MNNILLKKLSKKFNNENDFLFKNLNLQFIEGNIYIIYGKSGCGKTTLLNILSGKDNEYEGEVFINGLNLRSILEIDEKSYKQNYVSYIHQSSTCFEKLSIKDNLELPFLSKQSPLVSLSKFNIIEDPNKDVIHLSKGQQKRINIIQNIYKDSKLLLIDEPDANLDSENIINIFNIIKSLKKNKIIIVVTHNLDIAKIYGDYLLEIKDNTIVKNYKKKEINKENFKIDNSSNISLSKSKKCAKKFVKSESKNNKKILTSTILISFIIGILSSLLIGIYSFFQKQISDTNKETTVTIKSLSSTSIIEEDEFDDLNEEYNNELFYFYKNNEYINCSINDVYFELSSSIINYPNMYCENLDEDEIILTVPNTFLDNLIIYLGCEDIEDYMLFNDLNFSFQYNDNIFSYKIKEFFISEDENIYINSSNKSLYLNFHNENETKYVGFNKNCSEKLENFINSTNLYQCSTYNSIYEIAKYNTPIINYESFIEKYPDSMPLVSNDNSYWINNYQNILFFNNCKINILDENYNQTLFFTPFYNLSIGRYPEENNEVVVSKKIYNLYGSKILLNEIKIEYNNIINSYKVVGVSDDENTNYIYQSLLWARTEFETSYGGIYKALNYILETSPSNSKELVNNLKATYPDFNIDCYVVDSINQLEDLINKIIYVSLLIILFISLISISSIVIIFQLEKDSYRKQIDIMNEFGYTNNELNLIYFNIFIKRSLISISYCSTVVYLTIFLLNNLFIELNIFNTDIMSSSLLVLFLIIIINLIIYFLGFIICKFKNKKTLELSKV